MLSSTELSTFNIELSTEGGATPIKLTDIHVSESYWVGSKFIGRLAACGSTIFCREPESTQKTAGTKQ
jgi:hypothetical protein